MDVRTLEPLIKITNKDTFKITNMHTAHHTIAQYSQTPLGDLEGGVGGAPPPLKFSKIRVLGDIYTGT